MPAPAHPPLTRQQKMSLFAAWLGWAFDGLDGFLYVLIAMPFVKELVLAERGLTSDALNASKELGEQIGGEVTNKAAIIQAFFLFGWAIGGAVFGRIGDRLGRSRTLTLTILTYACFTGLSFFATRWWHLLIFRFLAALGIGGEWAAGSALVCETLDKRHRAWASAALQSGYQVGCVTAALTTGWMSHLPLRYVFLVGITPALLTLWIRRAVPEPEEWAKAKKLQKTPPVTALFSRELWWTTVRTFILTSVALTTVWAFLYFEPQCVQAIGAAQGWSQERTAGMVANVTIVYLIFNIIGNFSATHLVELIGHRWTFVIMYCAAMACYLGLFRTAPTEKNVYAIMSAAAFFSLGIFGTFPMYIPLLYPTLVRTLGAGFTYNAGRVISGIGIFYGGQIASGAGGAHGAIWWSGLVFMPGILVSLVAPRPKYA